MMGLGPRSEYNLNVLLCSDAHIKCPVNEKVTGPNPTTVSLPTRPLQPLKVTGQLSNTQDDSSN